MGLPIKELLNPGPSPQHFIYRSSIASPEDRSQNPVPTPSNPKLIKSSSSKMKKIRCYICPCNEFLIGQDAYINHILKIHPKEEMVVKTFLCTEPGHGERVYYTAFHRKKHIAKTHSHIFKFDQLSHISECFKIYRNQQWRDAPVEATCLTNEQIIEWNHTGQQPTLNAT